MKDDIVLRDRNNNIAPFMEPLVHSLSKVRKVLNQVSLF